LVNDLTSDMFATLTVYIFNSETNEVTFCNAGHGPFFYFSVKENKVIEVNYNSLPGGISEDFSNFVNTKIKLDKDDIILSYTDGLLEAFEHKYGNDGKAIIYKTICENKNLSAQEINAEIMGKINEVVGKMDRNDDISLLISKII